MPAGAAVLSLQMSWESAVWFQCEDSRLGQPEARVPPLLPEAYHVVSVSQTTSAFLECVVSRVTLSTQLGRGVVRMEDRSLQNFLLLLYSGHQSLL